MKELVIVRHAKSDWGNEQLKDIDRHLNERGYDDAYRLSEWYTQHHRPPERIICSPSIRTTSTALIFMRALQLNTQQLVLESAIYEAHRDVLKAVLAAQPDTIQKLMLVGHNPSVSELCNALCNGDFFDNLPTCALVGIKADCKTWKEFSEGRWELDFYQFPKEYR